MRAIRRAVILPEDAEIGQRLRLERGKLCREIAFAVVGGQKNAYHSQPHRLKYFTVLTMCCTAFLKCLLLLRCQSWVMMNCGW